MITLVQENPGIQLINPQAAAADEKTKAGWKHFSLFDKMRELRNNINIFFRTKIGGRSQSLVLTWLSGARTLFVVGLSARLLDMWKL